jgi:hypothetical protein
MRMVVVGAPSYFRRRPLPKSPQDLTGHDCINLRLPTYGGLIPWQRDGDVRAALRAALTANSFGMDEVERLRRAASFGFARGTTSPARRASERRSDG